MLKTSVLTLLLMSFQLLAGELRPEIHIDKEATVAEGTVTLGDVASFKDIDGDEVKSLRDIPLGEAPLPGQSITWTSSEISQKLRKLSSQEFGFQISIPETVKVSRGQKSIIASDIEDTMKSLYTAQFKNARVLVAVRSMEKILLESTDTWKLDLNNDRAVGNMTVPIVVSQKEGREKRFWAQANVRILKKVAVAKRMIEARSMISESDFTLEEKDVTYLSGSPVAITDLNDSMARTTILPDTIITRNHLERQTAVRAGEDVKIVVGDESFLIETRGTAIQNGYVGDVIRIRNAYNKQISGQIVAKGQVRVDYQ